MAVDLNADRAVAGQLRSSWFAHVYDMSDIDLQRRTWLDPTNRNPHWSYVEFVESYPKDDQLSYARDQGWLAAHEFEVLKELRRVLVEYSPPRDQYYDNVAVLNDPAWQSVVAMAQRARQQLLTTTTDPQEQDLLLGRV
jgi:hypothetical protein